MKYMLLLSYTSLYSIVWDNEKPLLCNRKQTIATMQTVTLSPSDPALPYNIINYITWLLYQLQILSDIILYNCRPKILKENELLCELMLIFITTEQIQMPKQRVLLYAIILCKRINMDLQSEKGFTKLMNKNVTTNNLNQQRQYGQIISSCIILLLFIL
ncbi:Hypothetical_protein [Hexamita inflata]|uniref:Hypothetical_protein n=1 Tax=Hexamita inflata TaxID=28002 RepID=A0AA86QV72_9EUKA|nr:Hypothetical protein HINF_LOCUS51432 [Hexamita inflata]